MYKKILAPLDGSELSECSLEHVRSVATGCHVPEVVLLRVIEPIPNVYEEGQVSLGSQEWRRDVEQKNRAWAETYLSKTADDLKKDGVAAQTAVVVGRPADEILDYIERNKVDLIIMSTHGRSGVSRWVIGSVAEKVLRHSAVPVLVVSPPGCRTGRSRSQ